MTTARQRVLAYFKKQLIASAAQIGRGLNMSAATVRYHLSIMVSDGRIEVLDENHKAGRGRPIKLYKLSEKTLGDNLAMLSDAALGEWLNGLSVSKRKDAMQAIARAMIVKIGREKPEVPAAKRLALVIEKLNSLHYQARWEAGAEGPRILFGHCPYAAIIKDRPELCQMDQAILGEMMQATARQTAKIGQPPHNSTFCIFHLL
jgi:predicted ArsR family transcriptional regulator